MSTPRELASAPSEPSFHREAGAKALRSADAPDPDESVPGPHGTRLVCPLGEDGIRAAVALVADEYWNVGVDPERLARALRGSTVVVAALDPEGRLVATARALSDGARSAWVGDVCVAKAWRGKGLGQAVVGLLLAHPRVRDADRVRLHTRDAQTLYERFGFIDAEKERREKPALRSTEMVRRRR